MTAKAVATQTNSAAASPPSLPRLSDGLKRATADRFNLILDPASDSYAWQPPENPTPALIDEAKRAALQTEKALQPAPSGMKIQWLVQLGVLTLGKLSAEEAKVKIQAYVRDLAHPPLAFTDETRIAAARRFKFFPAFAELVDFLDECCAPQRERLRRLRRLGAAIPPKPEAERGKRYSDMTDEEKRAFDQAMAPFRGASKRPIVPAGGSQSDQRYARRTALDVQMQAAAARFHAEEGDELTPTDIDASMKDDREGGL
jgi:hypothetical protein